jgi:hypothetical protein
VYFPEEFEPAIYVGKAANICDRSVIDMEFDSLDAFPHFVKHS